MPCSGFIQQGARCWMGTPAEWAVMLTRLAGYQCRRLCMRELHELLGQTSAEDMTARLDEMSNLLPPVVASHGEVLSMIDQHQLMGRSVGYIDMHLLAATLLTDTARLWTHDRRLARTAAELGIHYQPD